MMEYVVSRYENPELFNFGRLGRLGGGSAWGQSTEEDIRPSEMGRRSSLFYCENEMDAQNLANTMATRYPGTAWVVSRSRFMYATEPGPVQRSEFTDGGLLPA
jgi:hypothetical protein